MAKYGMSKTITGSVEKVKRKVAVALKEQGFGILTEIDMQKTLKEKIGAEIDPYLIQGACNPKFAYRAVSADPTIGLLLPCNVVLRKIGNTVEVSIQDPEVMFSVVDANGNEDLEALPLEVTMSLQAALNNLN